VFTHTYRKGVEAPNIRDSPRPYSLSFCPNLMPFAPYPKWGIVGKSPIRRVSPCSNFLLRKQ
jgi:hypothetical protein